MARAKKGRDVHGWLALDKPAGLSSASAVGRVRHLFRARKAGHGGTLDPGATGLLPIALGEATKTCAFVMDGAKNYHFTVRWGEERITDDAEGEIVATSNARPGQGDIEAALADFTGAIEQTPPRFSAIKVAGERAYALARKGREVDLAPRLAKIHEFRLIAMPDTGHAVFECICGKGVYVRALARDLGRKLGCFGHVSALRRTAVGVFSDCHMITLEKLDELRHKDTSFEELDACLMPVETALDDIPALAVERHEMARLKQGQSVIVRSGGVPAFREQVLVTWRGNPVAIAGLEGGILKPRRVFNVNPRP